MLTSSEVIDGTDITARQLDHWRTRLAVRPSVSGTRGKGDRCQWSAQDRRRLRVIDDVLEDLAALGIRKVSTVFVRHMWAALLDDVDIVQVGAVSVRLGPEDV